MIERSDDRKAFHLTLVDFAEDDYTRKLGLGVLRDTRREKEDTYWESVDVRDRRAIQLAYAWCRHHGFAHLGEIL